MYTGGEGGAQRNSEQAEFPPVPSKLEFLS